MNKIKITFNKEFSTLTNVLSVVILSTIIGFGFHLVFAWVGPGMDPPDDNVGPPITTAGGDISGVLNFTSNNTIHTFSGVGGPIGFSYAGEIQQVYRTSPNRLIIERVSDAADIFYVDLDDFATYFGGSVTIADYLAVNGTSYLQGNITNNTGDVTVADNLHVTDNLTVDGTISGGGGLVWKDSPVDLNWSCNNSWHTYDARPDTSSGVKGVIISVETIGGRWVNFWTRRNGSSVNREGVYRHDSADGKADGGMIIQGVNAGVLEYKCEVEGGQDANALLVGYFE